MSGYPKYHVDRVYLFSVVALLLRSNKSVTVDEQPKFNKVRCGLVVGSAATQLSPQKSSERQSSAPYVRTKNAKMQIFAYIYIYFFHLFI